MDIPTFKALLTPAGQEVLAAANSLQPSEEEFLRLFTQLKRQYPPALAKAALEIAILRREAGIKFPQAERMYFTRPALEQATDARVSQYRSHRYNGFRLILDLGCSVGGDTLSLAGVAQTIGFDQDSLRLSMAAANAGALGLEDRTDFVRVDLHQPLPVHRLPDTALFFDPGRRKNHRRLFSVYQYQPSLAVIQDWLPRYPAVGVKVSPGVKLDELAGLDAEVEFVSLHGALKEAVLWFGPLRSAGSRATILPGAHTLFSPPETSIRSLIETRILAVSEPRAYLYEPDPAIIRAGLVQTLGEQLAAAQLDPQIAYLTADQYVETPFARGWEVEAWIPFNVKKLRAVLKARQIHNVVIKKRGSPLAPEELRRMLRLPEAGGVEQRSRVLFVTRMENRPVVIICHPGGHNRP